MKKQFLSFLLLACCLAAFNVKISAQALNGNYTIDTLLATSSTNFRTFKAAADTLAKYGVSGAVTFTIAARTYNEQVIIPPIAGTSDINTVTFTGGAGNASTRILQGNTGGAIVKLSKCSHVIIRDITVTNTYTGDCSGISIIGDSSDIAGTGCAVKNCVINIPNIVVGSFGTTSFSSGINITGASNGTTFSATGADSIHIDSNIINGTSYGIYFTGVQDTIKNFNNKFRYNTLNYSYNGIIAAYIYNAVKISYNTINPFNPSINLSPYSGAPAISLALNKNTVGMIASEIIGNRITGGKYGILLNGFNTHSGAPLKIYNNMISSNDGTVGINLNASDPKRGEVECLFNTVYMKSSGTYALLYAQGSDTASIFKNNIFVTTTAAAYAASFEANLAGKVINYNNYYNTAGGNLIKRNGTDYSVSTYNTDSAGGDSSFNYLPSFVAPELNNMHIRNACTSARGADLSAKIPVDIDGNIRSVTPYIGCDEATTTVNNILLDRIVASVVSPFAPGNHDITVFVTNAGSNTVDSFTLSYKMNSGAVVSAIYRDTLNPCDTVSIVLSGINFIPGTNNFLVYSSNPNGAAVDSDMSNDTLRLNMIAAVSSICTIDNTIPTGSNNFNNFADAINALTQGGVATPVLFNVAAGTYNERVVIPAITGASPVNTITFDGGAGNAASRIITYAPTATANMATVQIAQSRYVSLRNLTIQTTGATFGWAVHIFGAGSNCCKIKNCIIDINAAKALANVTSYNGIVVNNNATNPASGGVRIDSLEIDSNTFNYGNYGVVLFGSSSLNNKIRNNTIRNTFDAGIYISSQDASEIAGNYIGLRKGCSIEARGIYISTCNSTGTNITKILGNTILNTGRYGIFISSSSNPGSALKGLIANNIIGGRFKGKSRQPQLFHNTQPACKWRELPNTGISVITRY